MIPPYNFSSLHAYSSTKADFATRIYSHIKLSISINVHTAQVSVSDPTTVYSSLDMTERELFPAAKNRRIGTRMAST